MHLIALHQHGSSNPLGITSNVDRIRFHPYYSFKDLVGLFVFFFLFAYFVFFNPNFFGESDNYIPANPLVTPISIVPEFYLLPFYAILRSIPHKLLGVIGMVAAILILLATPFLDTSRIRSMQFRPIMKFFFWLFVANFLILGWIGANHPESPLVEIGQVSTIFYFSYFLVILPVVGIIENTLFDLGTKKSINTPLINKLKGVYNPFNKFQSRNYHVTRSLSKGDNPIRGGNLPDAFDSCESSPTDKDITLKIWLLTNKPAKVYLNSKESKDLIYKENKSGIYVWLNTINEKYYVGSAVNLSRRFSQYYSEKYLKVVKGIIHKALLKNKHEKFTLYILEYCEVKDLILREQYYIDMLFPSI